ncbi:MAG: hypothetical protein ACRDQD_16065 [Nocardioidaceae bacterium]
MPLPSNANLGFVAGQFIDGTGAPAAGKKVTFTPSVKTLLDAGATPNPVTILPKKITVTLDENGYVPTTTEATAASMDGQHLLATTDTDLSPTGWTWKADFAFGPEFERSSFSFALDVGEQIDLTTESSIPPSGGAVIVQGIPTGGADGQFLAKASALSYDTEWVDPPAGGGGGSTTLDGLTDVSTAGATSGQVLKYNGTQWVPGTDLVGGGGGSTAWADITGKPAAIGAGADAAAARAAIGAGTSSLAIGTSGTTAKAGDYAPTWTEVSGKPASIAAGADAAAARAAIGAGTSSLAIGTTGSTAMAGNKTAANLGGIVSDPTGIPGAFALENFVGIAKVDYDALVDPETNYPNVTFLEV